MRRTVHVAGAERVVRWHVPVVGALELAGGQLRALRSFFAWEHPMWTPSSTPTACQEPWRSSCTAAFAQACHFGM